MFKTSKWEQAYSGEIARTLNTNESKPEMFKKDF